MRPLRIGVQLPEVERLVRWPEYAAMARAAEEVGSGSVWVDDHLLYRADERPERSPWDAWTLLAGLAGVTELGLYRVSSAWRARAHRRGGQRAAVSPNRSECERIM